MPFIATFTAAATDTDAASRIGTCSEAVWLCAAPNGQVLAIAASSAAFCWCCFCLYCSYCIEFICTFCFATHLLILLFWLGFFVALATAIQLLLLPLLLLFLLLLRLLPPLRLNLVTNRIVKATVAVFVTFSWDEYCACLATAVVVFAISDKQHKLAHKIR